MIYPGDLCKLTIVGTYALARDTFPVYEKNFTDIGHKSVVGTITNNKLFLILSVTQIPDDDYISIFLVSANVTGWIYEMPHKIVKL